jgi:hypothetical protein
MFDRVFLMRETAGKAGLSMKILSKTLGGDHDVIDQEARLAAAVAQRRC